MSNERKPEAYSERYATWRHLDEIRYRIIQLAIAFVSAITLIAGVTNGELQNWTYILVGLAFFSLWGVIARVNTAIVKNGEALFEFGKTIGDDLIPNTSKKNQSVFYYIQIGFFVLGVTFFIFGATNSIKEIINL